MDSDGDGVGNACDNCVNTFNPDQADSDGDGIGDACESCPDADNDGVCDTDDNCVFNPNPNQADSDNDGVGDVCDNCVNTFNPNQADSDGDGIGDACEEEGCPANVIAVSCGIKVTGLNEPYVKITVFQGVWGPQIFLCENDCSDPQFISNLSTGTYTVKVQTANFNGGWTQVCDEIVYIDVVCGGCPDADNDGVCDPDDNCVNTPNPDQADSDYDGVGDVCDNCPNTFNPNQADSDGDGVGDACESCPDADYDGVCDTDDNCVNTFNPDQADSDGDGVGDACDFDPVCDNFTSGGLTGFGSNCTDEFALPYCGAYAPTILNCIPPSGGSGVIEYIWLKSTTSSSLPTTPISNIENDPNWDVIPGANSPSYSPGVINQTTYFLRCARRAGCELYTGEGNIVTVTCDDNPTDCIDGICNVDYSISGNTLTITGLCEDLIWIKIFEEGTTHAVYLCNNDCGNGPVTVTLPNGTYDLDIETFTSGWSQVCNINETIYIGSVSGFLNQSILNLNAAKQTSSVDLQWINNTSYKNDRFIVERSADGVNFEAITEVADYNSDDDRAWYYNLVDEAPAIGNNFYRVKVLYKDGSFEYTNVKNVYFFEAPDFELFPNPAINEVFVNLAKYQGKDVTITIQDNFGRILQQMEYEQLSEDFTRIDLEAFKNGSYHIYIRTKEGLRKAKKLIVMKRY
jgi:hypothetical protein